MKRRLPWLNFAACALAGASAASPGAARARSVPALAAEFAPAAAVEVIAYPGGLTGLYDRGASRLYLYDAARRRCVGVQHCPPAPTTLSTSPKPAFEG